MTDLVSITTSKDGNSVNDEFDFEKVRNYWENKGINQSYMTSLSKLWLASRLEKLAIQLKPENEDIFISDWNASNVPLGDLTTTTAESDEGNHHWVGQNSLKDDNESESESTDDWMMKSVSSLGNSSIYEGNASPVSYTVNFPTIEFDTNGEVVMSTDETSLVSQSSDTRCSVSHGVGVAAKVCIGLVVCVPIAVTCGVLINLVGEVSSTLDSKE